MRDRWEEIKEERIRDRRKERRGLAHELRAYIIIAKIIVITCMLLMGLHVINQLDAIMTQQAHIIKTQADAMDQLMWIRMDLDELKEADKPEIDPPEQISLGEFTITHYCACSRCCGKSDGVTATGTQATEGRTIAVDPEVIPYGTKVLIDGHEYIAEDTGGAIRGNKIDIYVDSHQEAISRGRVVREVFVQ
jgi:3D (Asp-Asp-Asp) domain-containing protein